MPKIDPITGCTVMTQGEFWASEAAHEGKGRAAWEVRDEFYADMDAEYVAEEKRLSDDKVALDLLREKIAEWNKLDPEIKPVPLPVEVLCVESVTLDRGFRNSGVNLTALCRMGNNTRFRITLDEHHYSGSFYEPPDYDIDIKCERVK